MIFFAVISKGKNSREIKFRSMGYFMFTWLRKIILLFMGYLKCYANTV